MAIRDSIASDPISGSRSGPVEEEVLPVDDGGTLSGRRDLESLPTRRAQRRNRCVEEA